MLSCSSLSSSAALVVDTNSSRYARVSSRRDFRVSFPHQTRRISVGSGSLDLSPRSSRRQVDDIVLGGERRRTRRWIRCFRSLFLRRASRRHPSQKDGISSSARLLLSISTFRSIPSSDPHAVVLEKRRESASSLAIERRTNSFCSSLRALQTVSLPPTTSIDHALSVSFLKETFSHLTEVEKRQPIKR